MIYTPRCVIDFLTTTPRLQNKMTCTKIDFRGYEISISMDSSHGDGDLFRSDIRVYTKPGAVDGVDCSEVFLAEGESMLYGDAETLLRVMKKIETMSKENV